jgi:hypothetical protein
MADRLDKPMVYQIRIKGHLGSRWTEWFGGMTITREDDGDTLLTGPVGRSGRATRLAEESARSGSAADLGHPSQTPVANEFVR